MRCAPKLRVQFSRCKSDCSLYSAASVSASASTARLTVMGGRGAAAGLCGWRALEPVGLAPLDAAEEAAARAAPPAPAPFFGAKLPRMTLLSVATLVALERGDDEGAVSEKRVLAIVCSRRRAQ